jgi:molybdenum cofactor guanylyltransferase
MDFVHNITAFVLAGGKSSRMGTDKGMVSFRGKEMVRWPLDLVQPLFLETFIVANNESYNQFGVTVIGDLVSERGPLGGIFTALSHASTRWNFIVACDMPMLSSRIIEQLIIHCDYDDAVIPLMDNHMEPLCGFYNKSALPVIIKQLQENNLKMHDLLSSLRTVKVDMSTSAFAFSNMNTPGELKSAIE